MRVCSRCGEENPDRAKFCLACGNSLEAAASRQERKLISVLFVDLVGSTERADRADPEDVRDMLEAYHSTARDAIEKYGGRVEKFIGDAVMAVFGVPVSHGDDAERAVLAGLAVLQAIEQLNARMPALQLQARAAVNSGEAVVALGEGFRSGEAIAMGDVVNTAARLQGAAPPGGLVVGAESHALTRQRISYRELAPLEAKGKSEPLAAWVVDAESEPRPAGEPHAAVPMVGRDREVGLLRTAWERSVAESAPQLVTLLGPAGIGKSRLQHEFSGFVESSGGTVLRGRSVPYGDRTAYGAFVHVLKVAASVYEDEAAETVRSKLHRCLRDLLPEAEVEETARFLSLLMGFDDGEPALQRDYLFFAARRFVEGLGVRRPTLLLFEDVHWSDAALLDLVEYLAAHVREVPVVMLAVARPELLDTRPSWSGGLSNSMTVALDPLPEAASRTLAERLLTAAAEDSEMASRLAELAEGNPLFVEELAAAIAEGTAGAELPGTVRAAISARVDSLPPAARSVLLDAAVIGRTFWKGALAALELHPDLDSALATLERRDFIRRMPVSRMRGDVEFLIKHMLIRDIAYGTVPRSERRQRHAAIARYIESVASDARERAPLLAHHWREAAEPDRAIDYLLRVAEQAERGWAVGEAISAYDTAVELAGRDEQRREVRLQRGLALSRMGEYDEAYASLRQLLPELEGAERVEALLGWTWAAHWTERPDDTIAGAEEARTLAEHLGLRELVPVATARLSQGHAMRGRPGDLAQALDEGQRALETWVPGARETERLHHAHLLGEQYYWSGQLGPIETLISPATEAHGDASSLEARLRSAALRAQVLCATGRYHEGLRLFDQTIALARDLGRPIYITQNYSTLPLRDLFDLNEARRRSEESLENLDPHATFTMPRANAVADFVQTCILSGDLGDAERTWNAEWNSILENPAWSGWLLRVRLTAARADLELAANHREAAVDWARTAVDTAQSLGRLKYQAVGRTTLGRALHAIGQPVEAVAQLRVAVAEADQLGAPAQRWPAWGALGLSLYATGDDAGAEAAFREAARIIADIARSVPIEERERFLGAEAVQEVTKQVPL